MGRLIVFIHGIGGDAEGTFTNKKTGAYWPKLLGTDGDIFEGADIYSYEYESNIIGKGRGIDWLADEMAQNLESKIQISSYQSVVFVAHSLGGLVLRKYLLDENRAPNHGILAENRVKGIILFGVPTNGSTKADIAKVTGVSSKTLDQLTDSSADFDHYLTILSEDWLNEGLGRKVPSWCAYETIGVGFIFKSIVVDRASASALCTEAVQGVAGATHVNMVKPENVNAPAHQLLRGWYNKIFHDKPLTPTEVVLVSCGFDPYAETLTPLLNDAFYMRSIPYSASIRLPQDWDPTNINYLWRDQPPKVIVVHKNCFSDTGKDKSPDQINDSINDFNRFLSSVETSGVSIVMYTRGWGNQGYEREFKKFLTRENLEHYVDTRRICPVAIGYEDKRKRDARKIVKHVENILNGRGCQTI